MRKKEKRLYKDGIKNANGYKFSILKPKEKIIIFLLVSSLSLFLIISALDNLNIVSIENIENSLGIIDGVERQNSDFAIYYLDVGQSDCSIIVCNDEVLMIDTGTSNQLNSIRESLKSLNISTIDYMIITHHHDDHMGNASKIIDSYNVENIIMSDISDDISSDFTNKQLIKSIKRNNVNIVSAEAGYTFKIGNGWACLYSPNKIDDEVNNNSIVLKVVYGETSFLFQGDAEAFVEKSLIDSNFNLDSDVLKLGHHGSNTSSTVDFLNEVTPFAGIISCGSDNSYSHPNGNVIKRLDELGVDAYVTSLSGDIIITSDGVNINVLTDDENVIYNK